MVSDTDSSDEHSERDYDSDAPEAKQEAPAVGNKRKSRKKDRSEEMGRWCWTYNKPDGMPYGLYPGKLEAYPCLVRKRGKAPAPIKVTYTVYQEEVGTGTGHRHIQGYSEFGKTKAKQECNRSFEPT